MIKVLSLYLPLFYKIWGNIAVLRLSPGDSDATKTKVYLFLQTEQNAQALGLIDDYPNLFQPFERAYALYRLGRLEEASEAVEGGTPDDTSILHLQAQILSPKLTNVWYLRSPM